MGESSIERSRALTYHPDELVVALPHLNLVCAELGRLSVPVRERATDETLGLALVELVELVDSGYSPGTGDTDGVPAVDRLLAELRGRFADRFGGWVPRMGKNRVLHGVHGLEHVSGGGAGDPRPERDRPDLAGSGPDRPVSGGPAPGGLAPHWAAARADGSGPGDIARIGVLDTQIYPHHRLLGRFIAPTDAIVDVAQPPAVFSPWAGHATFVAGMIADRAPAAELEVRQVLDDTHATASAWDVARQMVAFRDCDVDVLNLSLGCYTADGRPPLVLSRAVELLAADVVLVAAAGNHGNVPPTGATGELTPRTPTWPAALDDVLAVGAHDGTGRVAAFTPKDAPWIALLAPGVDVRGDYLVGAVKVPRGAPSGDRGPSGELWFDGTAIWSGTSFAAAYVSGVIADRTVRGQRSAQEARDDVLRLAAGGHTQDIVPYRY